MRDFSFHFSNKSIKFYQQPSEGLYSECPIGLDCKNNTIYPHNNIEGNFWYFISFDISSKLIIIIEID